jgi:hypothetical protein
VIDIASASGRGSNNYPASVYCDLCAILDNASVIADAEPSYLIYCEILTGT